MDRCSRQVPGYRFSLILFRFELYYCEAPLAATTRRATVIDVRLLTGRRRRSIAETSNDDIP